MKINKQNFNKIISIPWCLFCNNQIKKFFGKIFIIIIIIDFELFNWVSTIIQL